VLQGRSLTPIRWRQRTHASGVIILLSSGWSARLLLVCQVVAAKQYPVVSSIDEVVVDGDRAEANVTSYMAFDPGTTSTRSFDLQFRNDKWKICQSS
jgi:cell division septal protein FtsQ